jgi:hypothetical protein
MNTAVTIEGERRIGAWQQPVNRWAEIPGSIHNDAVAKKVGMRGGTIPGTVHLGHFEPLLRELFGERWWRRGSISMFYTYATTHREDVRAVIKVPDGTDTTAADLQLDAWVETPEGRVVCKGTVAVGSPSTPGYVRALPLEQAPPGACRILAAMAPGQDVPGKADLVLDGDGAAITNPSAMYGALNVGFPRGVVRQPAVGFFGATEIVLHDGPIRHGTPYECSGRIVCVGTTPKTEFVWVDSELRTPAGQLVAGMRHMTRWMKGSSPLWSGDGSAT